MYYYTEESLFEYHHQYLYRHLPDDIDTIKYYFAPYSPYEPFHTWTTNIDYNTAKTIKNAITTSIMTWNDVYYYTYASNGTVGIGFVVGSAGSLLFTKHGKLSVDFSRF